jgi:chemotaxis protein MotB
VAYADFVTAMMAFFMVMWITAQNKVAKEAVSNYFQDPFATAGEANGPASGLSGGGPAMHRKGEQGKRPGVKAIPSDSSGLGTTIQFAPGSADLNETSKGHLLSLAPELSGIPQRIEIRGHTSRAPLASDSAFHDSWGLSYARCQATMQFLIAHGVEAQRIRLSQAGAFQLATNAENAELLRDNERVEVFVLREFVSPTSGVETKSMGNQRHPPNDDQQEVHAQGEDHHGDAHAPSPAAAAADRSHRPQAVRTLAAGRAAGH